MGPAEYAKLPAVQAVAAGLLALAAFGQAVAAIAGTHAVHAPPSGSASGLDAVPLGLLALAATVPLIFLRPGPAAVAITTATVLTLVAFGTPTVAALAAQVIASYRLGAAAEFRRGDLRRGCPPQYRGWARVLAAADSPYTGAGVAAPFAVLALTSHGSVAAVLLAALVPAAAGTGVALRARREALDSTADREALAETLTAHLARGERARIARELHDVVAHHISMISVQAETARLTTPGLSAAGGQRFAEIGDTARAGLTEMRRLLGVLREDAPGAATAAGADRPGTGGHGLLGMRERAVAVGGSLRTGPAPGGGFLIEAVLPAAPEAVSWPPDGRPEALSLNGTRGQ